MWVALIGAAVASPPDRTVRLFGVDPDDGGFLERLQVSAYGRFVVGRTRNSQKAFVLDTLTWAQVDTTESDGVLPIFAGPGFSPACSVTGVAPVEVTSGDAELYVSCANGHVLRYFYSGEGIPERDTTFDVTVGSRADGVWFDPHTEETAGVQFGLYVLSAAADGAAGSLHAIDRAGELDGAGEFTTYPIPIATQGFLEGAVVPLGQGLPPYLVLTHGSGNMTQVQLGNTGAGAVSNGQSGGFSCTDLTPSPDGTVLCISTGGAIAKYLPSNRTFSSYPLTLDDPRGVCASPDWADGWVAVTGNKVFVWELSTNGVVLDSDAPYYESPADADNPIQDMVTYGGYMYGGGEAGYLHVVTANPWIYPGNIEVTRVGADGEAAPAEAFRAGDTMRIRFAANQAAEVTLTDAAYTDGTAFGSTSVSEETEDKVFPGTLELTVTDKFPEGRSSLFLQAVSELGDLGHSALDVVVDNVPDPPGVSIAPDERALVLKIDGIRDEDLLRYDVYLSDVPFTAQDYPTGGPGTFREVTPVAASPGQDLDVRFRGLVNDTTYYMAARAVDAEGKESPMSNVVSDHPREFLSAAERAGDLGGTPCATGSAGGSWLGLVGVLLAAARRRRASPLAAAAALLAVGALATPGTAAAKDPDPWWRQDATPAKANFEVRYGSLTPEDPIVADTFDLKPQNLLQVEVGPQIFRYAEVDFGTGFYQELAFEKDDEGHVGSNRTMLTWFPFQLDATLRGHFVDEQPAVPFVRYGWDYVLWSSKTGPGGTAPTEVVRGGKFGTHYAIGANLLLDLLQPKRASFLEARTGINDSWITVEYRRQHVDGRTRPWSGRTDEGLDFSASVFQLGLKLDW